jgi:hypothetical protein
LRKVRLPFSASEEYLASIFKVEEVTPTGVTAVIVIIIIIIIIITIIIIIM